MSMEKGNRYCYKYPRPAVATDVVVLGYKGGEMKVLLIERGNEPFKGNWALPGGFMNIDEDAETCACRELEEETGLKEVKVCQLYTFSAVDRDPRYRVVSIVYYAMVKAEECMVDAGDDAVRAQWFALSRLPSLAFDHWQILQMTLERLKWRIRCQPIGIEMLPEQFRISDLHRLYESILQTTVDGRSFRRKIVRTGLLLPVKENAPATKTTYYKFDRKVYRDLAQKGLYLGI